MAADILADPSGTAAAAYLRRCNNPTAATIIKLAVADLQTARNRMIVATGLSLVALSVDTNRKGKYRRIIRGIPQTAIRSILRDPYTGKKPSLAAVRSDHGDADYNQAYLSILKRSGLFYSQQLPRDDVAPFERLGMYSTNRYWIVSPYVTDLTPDEMAEIAEKLSIKPADDIEFAEFYRCYLDSQIGKAATAPPRGS